MDKNNENHAPHITDKARHGTYNNCYIEGVRDEGYKAKINDTTIVSFKKSILTYGKGARFQIRCRMSQYSRVCRSR